MILGKPLCYAYLIIMQKHNGAETILFNHSTKHNFRAIAKGTFTKYETIVLKVQKLIIVQKKQSLQ